MQIETCIVERNENIDCTFPTGLITEKLLKAFSVVERVMTAHGVLADPFVELFVSTKCYGTSHEVTDSIPIALYALKTSNPLWTWRT
jgi:hypothetical protein